MIPVFRFQSQELLAALDEVDARNLPHAMKLGMNALGMAAQRAMKDRLQREFDLRRVAWNVNAIKIEKGGFATKTKWRVVILLDPRASYLEKFEEAGVHEPFGGRNYLWVPNDAVFRKRIIQAGDPLHPKNLHMRRKGNSLVGDQSTFMLRTSQGPVVIQRLGKGSGTVYTPASIARLTLDKFGRKRGGKLVQDKKAGTRLLYTLKERVKVPLKLEFVDTITSTVTERAVPIFREAIGQAMRPVRRR